MCLQKQAQSCWQTITSSLNICIVLWGFAPLGPTTTVSSGLTFLVMDLTLSPGREVIYLTRQIFGFRGCRGYWFDWYEFPGCQIQPLRCSTVLVHYLWVFLKVKKGMTSSNTNEGLFQYPLNPLSLLKRHFSWMLVDMTGSLLFTFLTGVWLAGTWYCDSTGQSQLWLQMTGLT